MRATIDRPCAARGSGRARGAGDRRMEGLGRGNRSAWAGEDAMTMTEQPVEPAEENTACCAHHGGRGPKSAAEAPETARERVNRRWNEILQETRVTQTGVQILFGFLLSVAFTP